MAFDLTEQPLDLLAFCPGVSVALGVHEVAGILSRRFIRCAGHATLRLLETASHL